MRLVTLSTLIGPTEATHGCLTFGAFPFAPRAHVPKAVATLYEAFLVGAYHSLTAATSLEVGSGHISRYESVATATRPVFINACRDSLAACDAT